MKTTAPAASWVSRPSFPALAGIHLRPWVIPLSVTSDAKQVRQAEWVHRQQHHQQLSSLLYPSRFPLRPRHPQSQFLGT